MPVLSCLFQSQVLNAHQVSKSGGFDLAAVGPAGAVRDQVNPELPLQKDKSPPG